MSSSASSFLWDRNKPASDGGGSAVANICAIKDGVDLGGVVTSFLEFSPKNKKPPPRRGQLRPTKSLPYQPSLSRAVTSASGNGSWATLGACSEEHGSQHQEERRKQNTKPPKMPVRHQSFDRSSSSINSSFAELEEENELLREQVRILQATLKEREQERTATAVALVEEEAQVSLRQSSSTLDLVEVEKAGITDENHQNTEELQRVISLSLELAESRATVDSLQGKLQHAENQIESMKQQLMAVAKDAASAVSIRSGSFRSWFGASPTETDVRSHPKKSMSFDTVLTDDATLCDSTCSDPEDAVPTPDREIVTDGAMVVD